MTQTAPAQIGVEPVADTLRTLLADTAGIAPQLVSEDSSFEGALAMDSLSFVSFQVAVERTFGIDCPLDELRELTRFDQVVGLVTAKVEDYYE